MAKKRTSKADGGSPDFENLGFEEAIAQIESINDRIESGEIGLEESLDAYERGMKLLAHCRGVLERAEQRIEELTPEADEGERE